MPAKTLVQDRAEAIRWLVDEGRDYKWMVAKYREKYNIETTVSMWASFRARNGLPRKIARDENLIPWEVRMEHRWAYPVVMLRFEARLREGRDISEVDQSRLDSWKQMLRDDKLVVHYVPDTDDGFFYVPREKQDNDLIRAPRRVKATPADGNA
ncbi:hypothetical protein ACFXAF_00225 [Kitasatospora sp. NPDC059463]|uniref:hypothetical protein n=1 Tax=unclassified Kitasatospora TaxID=2633591 RepID=UPI0036C8386F